MSADAELLVLRLGLIGLIFLFIAFVAVSLRGSSVSASQGAPARRGREWRLVVVRPGETGFARGSEFPLAGTMVVGRDSSAGVILPDASVSMRHARVERVDSGWRVSDLSSTNGTFVDGRAAGSGGIVVRKAATVAFGNVVVQLTDA